MLLDLETFDAHAMLGSGRCIRSGFPVTRHAGDAGQEPQHAGHSTPITTMTYFLYRRRRYLQILFSPPKRDLAYEVMIIKQVVRRATSRPVEPDKSLQRLPRLL